MKTDLARYYREPSDTSKISKKFAGMFGDTPDKIMAEVRKRMIHPEECPFNFNIENWPRLKTAKDIEKAFLTPGADFGNCRAFSLACVAIMRAKGIPARCRCGFATYFDLGFYEDHWVIEYMKGNKWQLADAQTMKLRLKHGEFINGGAAWQLVRKCGFDPSLFGFSGNKDISGKGLYYVIGNMIRDASGLLKSELTYAGDGRLKKKALKLSKAELVLLDEISEMILKEDIAGLKKTDISAFM